MIFLKVQKKDELIHLIGLESSDLLDLAKKDAVLQFKLGDSKVSITQVVGSRQDFIDHIKELGGVDGSTIIKP